MAQSIAQAQAALLDEKAQINALKMTYVRLQNFEKSKHFRQIEEEIELKLELIKGGLNGN
jgi:hypothetical protein